MSDHEAADGEMEEHSRAVWMWDLPFELPDDAAVGVDTIEALDIPDGDVRVLLTPAGSFIVVPKEGDEAVAGTIAGAHWAYRNVWPADVVVQPGWVVNPVPEQNVMLQTVALGVGSLTITDRRAIGVVWESALDSPLLEAHVDPTRRSGFLRVMTVRREAFLECKFGKVKRGELSEFTFMGHSVIEGEPKGLLHPQTGELQEGRAAAIRRVLNAFVEETGPLPSYAELLKIPESQSPASPGPISHLPPIGAPRAGAERRDNPTDPSRRRWGLWAVAGGAVAALIVLMMVLFNPFAEDHTEETAAMIQARHDAIAEYNAAFDTLMVEAGGYPTGDQLNELAERADATASRLSELWDGLAEKRDLGGDNVATLGRLRRTDGDYFWQLPKRLRYAADLMNTGEAVDDQQDMAYLDRALGERCASEYALRGASPELFDPDFSWGLDCGLNQHARLRAARGMPVGVSQLAGSASAADLTQAYQDLFDTGTTTVDIGNIYWDTLGAGDPGAPLAAYVAAIDHIAKGSCADALALSSEAAGQFLVPDGVNPTPTDFNAAPQFLFSYAADPTCLKDGEPAWTAMVREVPTLG